MSPAKVPRTRISGHCKGCRCPGCGVRLSRYRKHRNLALARGTWTPPVQAPIVADRLRALLDAGWTTGQIAYGANLSVVYVRVLLGQHPAKPAPATVRAATAGAISALGPADRFGPAVPDSAMVNPVGSIRRLQALAAVGWPLHLLAERLGHSSEPNLLSAKRIRAGTARRVIALLNDLWDVPGPSSSARIRAARRGWAPPAAWDEEDIDDPRASATGIRPAAQSTRARRSTDTRAYLAGEAKFLAAAGVDPEQVAERLGITGDYAKYLISACL